MHDRETSYALVELKSHFKSAAYHKSNVDWPSCCSSKYVKAR